MATEIIPIDDALVAAWRKMYTRGDYTRIAEMCNTKHNYVMNALSSGRAEKNLYNAMKKFYQKRSDLMNSQKKEIKKLNAA